MLERGSYDRHELERVELQLSEILTEARRLRSLQLGLQRGQALTTADLTNERRHHEEYERILQRRYLFDDQEADSYERRTREYLAAVRRLRLERGQPPSESTL